MRFWIKFNERVEFEYRDDDDKEVCERCLNEMIIGKCPKSRYAVRNNKNDANYIYCHDQKTVAKQAKHISKITTEAFSTITKAARKRSRDMNEIQTISYHNAKKMNASIGQKIDKIVSFDSYARKENKIDIIKAEILNSPEFVAREIFSVRKTVEQIEAEYNLIEILELSEPFSENDLTLVKVHKLLVLGFYFYQEEFFKKKVYVNIADTDLAVKVDYGVAKSAISPIFNNAVKYCKPNSNVHVNVKYSGDYIDIEFSMTSLYFDTEETKELTRLGVRGRQSENIIGEGIGLYAVSNFMRMHKGYYRMVSNESTCFSSGDKIYSDNILTLDFFKHE